MCPLVEILCPVCNQPLTFDDGMCTCAKGHRYAVKKNIIDFMPKMSDERLKEEEEHWDLYAEKGKASIDVNPYIKYKIYEDYDSLFYKFIINEWPDYSQKRICVAEIGCGYGSAIRFLKQINFAEVDYVGMDLSFESMLDHNDDFNKRMPSWKVRFVRASANRGFFGEGTLDMVFSTSALHHLQVEDVVKWISKSLKTGGLFIINEPSEMNLFAKIGRRFVSNFNTPGERPLSPKKLKKIANNHDLHLKHEKGLHCLSGPMMYLVEMLHFPKPLTILTYCVSNIIDRLVISPAWGYSFIQVYRRE